MYETPKPDLSVAAKPRVNRSLDQPQQRTVNKVPLDQPQPQPQPKVERSAPQPQPKAERADPQPRGKDPAGPPPAESKQDKPKEKDKK